MPTHKVVFTDIDGTLIDINTEKSWLDYGVIEMRNSIHSSIGNQNIIKINEIGPSSWENAIHKFVMELNYQER